MDEIALPMKADFKCTTVVTTYAFLLFEPPFSLGDADGPADPVVTAMFFLPEAGFDPNALSLSASKTAIFS